MKFFKKFFSKKNQPIQTYADFWQWFSMREKEFFRIVQTQDDIQNNFFGELANKLDELKTGLSFMAGMPNEKMVELILTVDGAIHNIVFVEELIESAPPLEHWTFTTHQPSPSIKEVKIGMSGFSFDSDTLHFYANEHDNYPDEIDITVLHPDHSDDKDAIITNGVYIFLDNALGELNFATSIDNLVVANTKDATQPLVPIYKLRDFLIWRQKEFIEKYDDTRYQAEEDRYTSFEAKTKDNLPAIATINTDALAWENKPSHPWIMILTIPYDGHEDNGMPVDESTLNLLNDIEDEIASQLHHTDGYLYIGRETAENSRQVFFACKEFRKCSKVVYATQLKYKTSAPFKYRIYKDKYWRTFNRFIPRF
jgi:hypothetical protein